MNDYRMGTDFYHAQVLADAFANHLRWVPQWGWMLWDGKRWRMDEGEATVMRWASETLVHHYLSSDLETKIRQKMARQVMGANKVHSALAYLRSFLKAEVEQFDGHDLLLNTPSGVVDLTTGSLLPHSPSYYLTCMTRAPYQFNASAPTFVAFLNEIFHDNQELIHYVQKLLGYSLRGGNPEQVFIILWGRGANGKTTLMESILWAMGDYARETPPETFELISDHTVRNDLARLAGTRIVSTSESKETCRLDAATIKRLTGGDMITARFLYKEYFEFHPKFTPFMKTNFKPWLPGDDMAVWRRIRLIPFTVSIPPEKQNKNLLNMLKEESEGILAWLVHGYLAYQSEGLGIAKEVHLATQEYHREASSVVAFLQDCTEPEGEVSAQSLYQSYVAYCQEEGIEPCSITTFGRKLKNLGYSKEKKRNGVFYLDIHLKKK